MEFLADNLWMVWAALALILFAIEAATVDFAFVMLGIGALAGAVAAVVGASGVVQVVVAIVVALLLTWVIRPLVKARFINSEASRSIGSAALPGRTARVLETVTAVDGRVRLDGETWSARLPDGDHPCEPGQEVQVLSIDGATAIVTAKRPS